MLLIDKFQKRLNFSISGVIRIIGFSAQRRAGRCTPAVEKRRQVIMISMIRTPNYPVFDKNRGDTRVPFCTCAALSRENYKAWERIFWRIRNAEDVERRNAK